MMEQQLAIEGLKYLLLNYPYHSVLWKLYSVCKDLRALKPSIPKQKRVMLYRCDPDDFYGGHSPKHVDGFYIDPPRHLFYMCYNDIIYYVPKEWVMKLYRLHSHWYINNEDFCCRINVSRRGMFVDKHYKVLKNGHYVYFDKGYLEITDESSVIYEILTNKFHLHTAYYSDMKYMSTLVIGFNDSDDSE